MDIRCGIELGGHRLCVFGIKAIDIRSELFIYISTIQNCIVRENIKKIILMISY